MACIERPTARQTPGECHKQVTSVVDMAGNAPPAGDHQTGTTLGVYVLNVCEVWFAGEKGSAVSACQAAAQTR